MNLYFYWVIFLFFMPQIVTVKKLEFTSHKYNNVKCTFNLALIIIRCKRRDKRIGAILEEEIKVKGLTSNSVS